MSEGPVEVIRNYFQARNETGREPMDLFARNVVWETRSDLPDTQSYQGHDGLQALFMRFREVLQDMWFEPEDFILAGNRWSFHCVGVDEARAAASRSKRGKPGFLPFGTA